jgi:hypothetical protein
LNNGGVKVNKKYVSFYQLAKEMALEKGLQCPNYVNLSKEDTRRSEWENQFKNYRDTKQKYFVEILKNQGINPEIKYKVNGEFQIPVVEKESIKLLIKEYTSKYYRKLKNGKDIDVEDIEELVKKAERVIQSNFKGEEVERQLDALYGATEYNSRKASNEAYNRVTKMIYKSMDNLKIDKDKIDFKQTIESNKKLASLRSVEDMISKAHYDESIVIPKARNLNDSDAECLILFYEQMLTTATEKWNKIADIFSELRDEEIQADAFQIVEFEEALGDGYEYSKNHREPEIILKESIKIMNDELIEVPKANELTELEIKKLGDIIKSLNPNKK